MFWSMPTSRRILTLTLVAGALSALAPVQQTQAHANAGERLFPTTLTFDDPDVNDELTLPQADLEREPGDGTDPDNWVTMYAGEFSKRVTKDFGLSVDADWVNGGSKEKGWDNVGVGGRYVFLRNAPHEAIGSVGLDWDIGGTGAKSIGERFNSYTPALFFGKGFGDLPDGMDYLKPLALTGTVGISIPDQRTSDDGMGGQDFNSQAAVYGLAVEYSIPYLQQHVKDVGIGSVFATAVPLVEFNFQTPTSGSDRGERPDVSGRTTGTINPGVIFMGQSFQVGVEAVIPVNTYTGGSVGGQVQLHFYLDDLFGNTFLGKPIL